MIAKFYPLRRHAQRSSAFHEWFLGIDVRAVLPSIHVPTLIVHADSYQNAEADAGEHGRYLVSCIPGATFADVRSEDFPPWLGGTDTGLAATLSFIDSVRRDERELDRVLATVMFTDIVGSTERGRWRRGRRG